MSLTFVVIVLGTVAGIAIGSLLQKRSLRFVLYPIIDTARALPPLVLILFMYYLLTRQVIGLSVQAFWVCVIAMSLNLAAFTSDLVRSSVENVPTGIIDAGRALGMSRKQIRTHIVLQHVFRDLIPGMMVLYIGILKMTSLASVINVRETVYAAQTVIADIARSLEAWIIVGLIYVTLIVPATYAARLVEKWANRGSRPTDVRHAATM